MCGSCVGPVKGQGEEAAARRRRLRGGGTLRRACVGVRVGGWAQDRGRGERGPDFSSMQSSCFHWKPVKPTGRGRAFGAGRDARARAAVSQSLRRASRRCLTGGNVAVIVATRESRARSYSIPAHQVFHGSQLAESFQLASRVIAVSEPMFKRARAPTQGRPDRRRRRHSRRRCSVGGREGREAAVGALCWPVIPGYDMHRWPGTSRVAHVGEARTIVPAIALRQTGAGKQARNPVSIHKEL